jgi:putative polyhydroxyalkanoate system protein
MPTIRIEHPHSLGREEVKKRVQTFADREAARHRVHAEWLTPDELGVKAPGVTARLLIEDAAVVVTAELGLLLWPFKGRIESELREGLKRELS